MTPEQEDIKYGDFHEFVLREVEKLSELGWLDTELLYNTPPVDVVWEGWDAAFIESKGCNACQGATLESTGLDAVVGQHLKQVPGKKGKLDEFSLVEVAEAEESPGSSEEIPLEERTEYAVTLLAYKVVGCLAWPLLKSLPAIDCKDLWERLFDCTVKFVLSIFDEEDFYRICHHYLIRKEHLDFCNCHANTPVSSGDLSPTKFSYLFEPDVCYAWQQVEAHQAKLGEGDDGSSRQTERSCLELSDVARTSELMQKHRPLKGCLQAQLMLELSCQKCYHVLDTLILEAINGTNLPKYDRLQEFVVWDDYNDEEYPPNLLVMLNVAVGLQDLSVLKCKELLSVEQALIDTPASYFGPFKDEVFEVMKRANHERRIGKCRFIGLAHVWSALSFSRVHNMLPDIVCYHLCRELCLPDGSSEMYTLTLFKLSRRLAKSFGHEEVGLEHVVFSIVYGSSERTVMNSVSHPLGHELFKRLAECVSDSFPVESWRNIDIFTTLVETRCRIGLFTFCKATDVVKKLHESLEFGRLVLPKDEYLRVV